MIRSRLRSAAVFIAASALVGCFSEAPTRVHDGVPETHPAPALPVPGYPPLSRPGAIYDRVTGSFVAGDSRYVLYDDGTFALQYVSAFHFFEYSGRWTRVNTLVTFSFKDGNDWTARAVAQGDSLVVKYDDSMSFSDFEDGMYRSVAPLHSVSGVVSRSSAALELIP
jgi:hypothetical protein